MTRSCCSIVLACLLTSPALAQKLNRADKAIVSSLKTHITYLADDKLEGRRAGTKGEKLAMEYISGQFGKAGLIPKGDSSWFQNFSIYDGKEITPATHFIVNGNDLKLNSEYFPLAFSPNKTANAAVEMALLESGVPWRLRP